MASDPGEGFRAKVYAAVKRVPRGTVATYGQIAFLVGRPERARMVGQAMANAPGGRGIPCHRVVNSQGRTAPGWNEQRPLLEAEGVVFKKNGCVDMKKCGWDFF